MKHNLLITKKSILTGLALFAFGFSFSQNISTVAGVNAAGFAGDGGAATLAKLATPAAVTMDAAGNVYIADFGNDCVRKITVATGIITTVAGMGGNAGYTGDGGAATSATLNWPSAIAFDAAGNMYIADKGNSVIRMVTKATGKISTVAGTSTQGFTGDGGLATSAELNQPSGVAVDGSGNIYIDDFNNNRIRVVASGVINTICGSTAGYAGDGGIATSAKLSLPNCIALDKAGNLYISDNGNHRIRMISKSTGIINTIAGTGATGATGDGGPATSATISTVFGLTVDTVGNVYIADAGNNKIRKITNSTGNISTIAGTGTGAFAGDGGPATSADLHGPEDVKLDLAGNIYIADAGNNRIRKISGPAGIDELTTSIDLNVYPNPSNGQFTITIATGQASLGSCKLSVYNILGKEVYTETLNDVQQNKSFAININGISNGLYIMQLSNTKGIVSKRIVVQR
jgi:hypothetical protein